MRNGDTKIPNRTQKLFASVHLFVCISKFGVLKKTDIISFKQFYIKLPED